MDLADFLITLLSSAGASAALAGVLVFLSRNWLSERLRHSIKHEYDLKLTHLNNELKAESEKNVILLKTSIEREAEKVRFANASISQTQKLSIERKLSAIETLWEGVLAARKNIPVVMGFIDILTEDEYSSMKNHRDFQAMVGELSTEKITQMYEDNVGSRERVRPYVGEYTWALVSTYQSIILRTALLIQMGQKDSEKLNWHLDSGIQQLLNSALSETEVAEFDETKIGKVNWIQRKFEFKILAAMQVVISGEQFGDEALRQAMKMEEKVQQLSNA
ncbi:hypothetical protein [Aestuariirhabdus sp. LZHN29]|uniref:hypothetical protein n=1 Tax=Aestuariirhabdus sp. LZHN29 TaxID=3417462 RepID=UPI003CF1402C